MAFKKYVNKAKGVVKRVYKKRYVRKGKTNYTKMVKDVMYLKSVLNPEKKKQSGFFTDVMVGQCSTNTQGWFCSDITPSPPQNAASSGRNGNSIKLHASHIKYQFQAQSSTNGSPVRYRLMIVKTKGTPIAAGDTYMNAMFLPNTFITLSGVNAGIIDYNSDRREDTFKQFTILRSKNIYLKPNNHTGQIQHVTGSIGLKYKSHHVKFATDASNARSDGQLMLIILADNGNIGGTTSSLVGTQAIAPNTGANVQMDISTWYYDN